jgi:hypothetical protein
MILKWNLKGYFKSAVFGGWDFLKQENLLFRLSRLYFMNISSA